MVHAYIFFRGADKDRYSKLFEDIDNTFARTKVNQNPKTIAKAYEVLTTYRNKEFYDKKKNKDKNNQEMVQQAVAFIQARPTGIYTNERTRSEERRVGKECC